jgi:magnesium chelatase family protein
LVKLSSATLEGIKAQIVIVECTFTRALPSFSIVGSVTNDIQESKERTKAALGHIGFKFPPLKITINIAPASLYKTGAQIDLAIALAVALNGEEIRADASEFIILGELGLDGAIKNTNHIFPVALSLARQHKTIKILTSRESAQYLSKIPNTEVYAVENLADAALFMKSELLVEPYIGDAVATEFLEIDGEKYYFDRNFELDFWDVKGQAIAKRAMLIASAGFHNILLEGSAGCGKSMMTKRLRYILPPMQLHEILHSAMLDFMEGKVPSFRPHRPYRAPHHTSTRASVLGGGSSRDGKPGEVALSNFGVLYFDELPFFDRAILEALREPMEDNRVLVSRVNTKNEYEASFLFAASQNPCPCGNLLSSQKECRCTESEIQKYKNRLSEPFLDRIDLFVQTDETKSDEKPTLTSSQMQDAIINAFKMQKGRNQQNLNGKLSESKIDRLAMENDAQDTMHQAANRFGLSLRAINKVKKVARTIADLEECDMVAKRHILEALSFRRR